MTKTMLDVAYIHRHMFGVDRMWKYLNDNISLDLITREEAQSIAEKARQMEEKRKRCKNI